MLTESPSLFSALLKMLLLSWIDKDKALERNWVSALFLGGTADREKPQHDINVELWGFFKACMIQSMNLGWICGYQNKNITCVETSRLVIWTVSLNTPWYYSELLHLNINLKALIFSTWIHWALGFWWTHRHCSGLGILLRLSHLSGEGLHLFLPLTPLGFPTISLFFFFPQRLLECFEKRDKKIFLKRTNCWVFLVKFHSLISMFSGRIWIDTTSV